MLVAVWGPRTDSLWTPRAHRTSQGWAFPLPPPAWPTRPPLPGTAPSLCLPRGPRAGLQSLQLLQGRQRFQRQRTAHCHIHVPGKLYLLNVYLLCSGERRRATLPPPHSPATEPSSLLFAALVLCSALPSLLLLALPWPFARLPSFRSLKPGGAKALSGTCRLPGVRGQSSVA